MIEDIEFSGCPTNLRNFINMRLGSEFFTPEYKENLKKEIAIALTSKDWAEVKKIMWPMIGE